MTNKQREVKNTRQREYNKTHREEKRQKAKVYYHKNKETLNLKAAIRRFKTKERDLEYAKEYRKKNRIELNNKQKARYELNPSERMTYNRLHKYGVTQETYSKLLEAQQGRCAICGGSPSNTRNNCLHVDHDHETGAIRGLLCNNCNLMLGHARDKAENLRLAADYLDKHKET